MNHVQVVWMAASHGGLWVQNGGRGVRGRGAGALLSPKLHVPFSCSRAYSTPSIVPEREREERNI